MPEILPNWHPALVHFPIALSFTATLLLLAGRLRPNDPLLPAMARLLLYLAAGSALFAVAAGWYAFETVDHDAAGHAVMLKHRAWAVCSAAGLIVLALWDGWRQRAGLASHALLLPAMLALCGGLTITTWLGAEMVYRHGVGVSAAAFAPPPEAAGDRPVPATPAGTVQDNALPAPPETPVAPASPTGHGEHVHKDGKRHRH